MKLKLGTTVIFAVGALLAIGLSWQLQSNWYMLVLAPFALWAWLYAYEEIDVDSWHYQIASEVFGEKIQRKCKSCSYWGAVLAAVVLVLLQILALSLIWLIVQFFYHPVITFGWLWGYKPRYWRWVTRKQVDGKERVYLSADEVKQQGHAFRKENHGTSSRTFFSWYMPIIVVVPLAILEGVFQLGMPALGNFYHNYPWYVTVPATYFALHFVILLGNTWVRTGWAGIRWFVSSKACPDVKFVAKAKAPAKPTRPSTPASNPR